MTPDSNKGVISPFTILKHADNTTSLIMARLAGTKPVPSMCFNMVPRAGLEPACPCERGILNPLCIPFHHRGIKLGAG